MDFWPEYLAGSWGREFVAGGCGGTAGVITGYPLDTLRILQQQSARNGSALSILRRVVATEGPAALYRGMAAPFASVTFQVMRGKDLQSWDLCGACYYFSLFSFGSCQFFTVPKNAIAFQTYAILSKVLDSNIVADEPPSYRAVALGGMGTGAVQSLFLSPVELIKIHLQLQLQQQSNQRTSQSSVQKGPIDVSKFIFQTEGWRGIYRGLTITVLRDAPAHCVYFWTYEYMREKLHPGCRKNGQETFGTMLLAGGLAGVASWISSYPLDVIKTRIQSRSKPLRYSGIVDCFTKIVREEGYIVLWRGLGTAVTRAFIVNGTIFTAYEVALRCLFHHNGT